MFPQTRPWWHALTVSTAYGRTRHEGMLQACRTALREIAAAIFRRRSGTPGKTVQRPEPPPIRWEM
jgi:hypothetical protein